MTTTTQPRQSERRVAGILCMIFVVAIIGLVQWAAGAASGGSRTPTPPAQVTCKQGAQLAHMKVSQLCPPTTIAH